MKYLHSKRGYTLLFSVLTAALVLGVAAFILSVSRKQLVLASAARESMHAIYAADSGIECIANNPQALSTTTSPNTITCNGASVQQVYSATPNDNYITSTGVSYPAHSTTFAFGLDNGCTIITIYSFYNEDNNVASVIQSRGYNICSISNQPAETPKIVERALQISYE